MNGDGLNTDIGNNAAGNTYPQTPQGSGNVNSQLKVTIPINMQEMFKQDQKDFMSLQAYLVQKQCCQTPK